MSLCCELPSAADTAQTCDVQRRLLIGAGALGVSAVTAYSDDLNDLQFDAATAAGHFLKLLDAESAHSFGIWAAKHGLVPREGRPDPSCLRTTVWGRTFRNPIGAASAQHTSNLCTVGGPTEGCALLWRLGGQARPGAVCAATRPAIPAHRRLEAHLPQPHWYCSFFV